MLTAALFELDGVLVDVAPTRAESLLAALAAEGIDPEGIDPEGIDPEGIDPEGIDPERVSPGAPTSPADPVGWLAPFDDLAGTVAPGAADETTLALAALRAERDYAARVAAGVALAPGAVSAVAATAAEWRVAVVTGWRRADAEQILALAGLDAIVRSLTAADDGPPFPSPAERVRRALARLRPPGTPPEAVVAVVASPAALAAARAARARTVLLTPGLAAGVPSSAPLLRTNPVCADARLASLQGLTPARLAAALDIAPPRSPSHPSPR